MIDLVLLSRIQFAITVFFHYIFVPLTIGLGAILSFFEYLYLKTENQNWKKLAIFWGNLFKINFAFGIVTGFSMTFQFGTNWGSYSEYMGDIFASPLALEALIAFFLEATFFGIWISIGHDKRYLKFISMLMVSIGTTISSLWIITANAFMQNPVGYQISNDGIKIYLVNFIEVLSNPYLWHMLIHTLLAAYLLTSMVIIGISSYKLLNREDEHVYSKSIKIGMYIFLVVSILIPISGMMYGHYISSVQPIKAASMEAIWDGGTSVPMYLFLIPGNNGSNLIQALGIQGVGSYLLTGNFSGFVVGLNSIDIMERPNVPLVFLSFRLMVILWSIFLIQAIIGVFYILKNNININLKSHNRYLKCMLYSIPLPYIVTIFGWTVAEVGRQPWIVYGLLKTTEAISFSVPLMHVLFTLVGITIFYLLIGFLYIYLMKRSVKTRIINKEE